MGGLVQPTVGFGANEEVVIHIYIQVEKENENLQSAFPPHFKSVETQGLVLTLWR